METKYEFFFSAAYVRALLAAIARMRAAAPLDVHPRTLSLLGRTFTAALNAAALNTEIACELTLRHLVILHRALEMLEDPSHAEVVEPLKGNMARWRSLLLAAPHHDLPAARAQATAN